MHVLQFSVGIFLKNFENSQASGELRSWTPRRGRPPKVFPPYKVLAAILLCFSKFYYLFEKVLNFQNSCVLGDAAALRTPC